MKKVSAKFSFEGWKLVEFIKGQEKSIVALLAAGLGWLALTEPTTAFWSGLIFSGIYAVVKFYLQEKIIDINI